MVVIGCLFLVILPLLGLVLGGLVAGPAGAKWAALAGFAVAVVLCGISTVALVQASRRR
jgi:hypothetical protein